MNSKVKLLSLEGTTFEVDAEVAKKSKLIQTILEDRGDDEEITLPNVKLTTLKKVMEYCTLHKSDEPAEIEIPLKSANLIDAGVEAKDVQFIQIENLEELFDLILAANDLDIKSLLDLSCAKIASLIKNKTPEEIRQTFNIQNNLTPEEEAQIREENKWAEEASA